jgi:phosphoserine phosphatase
MPTTPLTRVLHIDITGPDRAGVTYALTTILGDANARIRDIGQAVIHDALALGLLVELTDEMKSSSLLTDLLLKAHELGVHIRFTAVSGRNTAIG